MTALRTFLAAGGAAALLLAMALPADAQVSVHRGINPWTGHAYRNVTVRNPWTGRVATSSTVVDPWTGRTARNIQVYNPWSGRGFNAREMYDPWTGRSRWDVNRRRGWGW
jgi:hypothetical protein